MKIKAYIDTNVFIYAIVHHQEYGEPCRKVLVDVQRGNLIGYGSYLVAIELLGALSKIGPICSLAGCSGLFEAQFKTPSDRRAHHQCCGNINTVVNLRYDAIHLALMLINGMDTIITYDLDDWNKAASKIDEIKSKLSEEGYRVEVDKLKVITPTKYAERSR